MKRILLFWSLEYYTFLFNVDTNEVLYRLLRSLIPYPPTFLDLVKRNPDLYGPFWIASTLIFFITFSSHIAAYLSSGSSYEYDVGKLRYLGVQMKKKRKLMNFMIFSIVLLQQQCMDIWRCFQWHFRLCYDITTSICS